MGSRTAQVGSRIGLHAKTAGLISAAVSSSGHAVTMATEAEGPVDASSPLMIMTLGTAQGDLIRLDCADEGFLDRLVAMVEAELDDLDYLAARALVEQVAGVGLPDGGALTA